MSRFEINITFDYTTEMALTINSLPELIVLAKALSLGKFECREYNAQEMAASPYSGDLLLRITQAMEAYVPNYRATFGSIEQNPAYLEVLKVHVSHIDDWASLDGSVKTQVVKNIASPYTISQSTIDAILSGLC